MHLLGVVPARLESSRLPGKPLRLLAGQPLIAWVVRRLQSFQLCDHLVVATDASAVRSALRGVGVEAVLTGERHRSGTERVAEAIEIPELKGFDLILNLQCDEPFIPREALRGAVAQLERGEPIGTAAAPLEARAAQDPHRVKVVTDARGRALHFSRAPIPAGRGANGGGMLYQQHVGVYAYTRDALREWVSQPPAPTERAEQLEQLRPLYYGTAIGVATLDEPAPHSIDTEEDLRWAEDHLHLHIDQGKVLR